MKIRQLTKERSWRDALLAIFVIIATVLIFSQLDAFETVISFSRAHETWEMDEIILTLLISPAILAWFAIRRWKEAATHAKEKLIAQQKLENSLKFDPLTQLPGRTYFLELLRTKIETLQSNASGLLLITIDIDNFNAINESLKREDADALLVNFANTLTNSCADNCIVARVTGDEFYIAKSGVAEHLVEQVVSDLVNRCNTQISLSRVSQMQLTCCIGATYHRWPGDGEIKANALVRQAERALYLAKKEGQNSYHLYRKAEEQAKQREQQLRQELRDAISNDELTLFYQPQMDMREDKLVGAEALVRWKHPDRGFLTPDKFIHLVSGNPLSIELGEWVIRHALQELSRLNQIGIEITISVNIAPFHLQQNHFAYRLKRMLQNYPDVDAEQLKIEIVETGMIRDTQALNYSIKPCLQLGVGFSLDDFGTGYSALDQLRQLYVSELKIDRSFVSNILESGEDAAMVESIIYMAGRLNMAVVAEGVESQAHKIKLLEMGCRLAQGYYYSRPLSDIQLHQWIAKSHDTTVV